jgi:L-ascorbate metabolism protein UlaG (beta-lactamase superfamily)
LDFNSPILERILSARTIPLSDLEFADIFKNIEPRGGLDYRELFTTDKPKSRYQPFSSGVRLQYTGHAGFLVESEDVSIVVDPVISSRSGEAMDSVFGFDNLPEKIDYICLTHSHQDHFNIETLLQLRYKTDTILVPKNNGGTLSDPSMKLLLQQLNFKVIEMDDMESIELNSGSVMALPFLGEHGDLNIRSKAAWFIELQGKKIFLGADSSNIDPSMYQHIHKVVGDIDLLAIGMECVGAPYTWIYGALHSKKVSRSIKDSRRLNGCDAQMAYGLCQIFNPKEVYIYALGLEPWFGYFMGIAYDDDSEQIIESNKMLDMCREIGLPCEKLVGEKIIEYAV